MRFIGKLKSRGLRPSVFPFEKLAGIVSENNHSTFSELIPNLPVFSFFKNMHNVLKAGKSDPFIIVVNLLPKDLHAYMDRLHSEVYRNVREMTEFSDAVLLFYGKCAYNPESETRLKSLDCPVYFLNDKKDVAEDCISIALGGNDNYTETKDRWGGKGSIYATPMWVSSFQEWMAGSTVALNDIEKYLGSPEYGQLFKINNPSLGNSDYHRHVSEFAKYFDMNIIEVKGSMELSLDSYMNAKANVCKYRK